MEKQVKEKKKKPHKIQLDEKLIYELAKIQCTNEEIAAVCGCSADTIERRARDIVHKGKLEGRTSLRRRQFRKAMEGSAPMMIWLGKHWLDQKDEVHVSSAKCESKEIFGIWNKVGATAIGRLSRQETGPNECLNNHTD